MVVVDCKKKQVVRCVNVIETFFHIVLFVKAESQALRRHHNNGWMQFVT